MKLEKFFEKFELFADAPNAVTKMRELILQLSVQGKLVEQNPSDEPANILLERIRKTKSQLIGDRAIKRLDTAPISDEQVPFDIPATWVWTRLGEVGDWGSGSTPTRGNHELYDGGITWLKSGELNDNQTLTGSVETVSELALNTGSFRRNQPGDVLLAMYGATIGKAAILAEPAVTNQAVCGCTPFDGVVNRYLFNFLVSQRANFHAASEGGAQPNISKVKIVGFSFPLPPLAEQKRIVAKVDELMALCDRLEAQQQERVTRHAVLARASLARFAEAPTPANLDFLFHQSYNINPADLRKSILTLAVQGKLVPQNPNEEPAGKLLQRVVSSAKMRGVSDEVLPSFDIPESWEWVRLPRVLTKLTDGTHHSPPNSETGEFKYVTAKNIKSDGVLLDGITYVTKEIHEEIYSRCNPSVGDVLYIKDGATTGIATINQIEEPFSMLSSVALLKPNDAIYNRYLLWVMRSPFFY